MRKLHLISLALLAAPLVVMHACGDDEQPAAPTGTAGSAGSGGSGTGGSGGSGTGGGGTAGKGGSATGGGGSGTAGSAGSGTAGSGGAKADGGPDGSGGTGGSATEGGTDAPKSDAPTSDAPISDAPMGDASAGGRVCTDGTYSDAAIGLSCKDYCDTFMAICNAEPALDAGSAFYANRGACITSCGNFTQLQLCCRADHVRNAIHDERIGEQSDGPLSARGRTLAVLQPAGKPPDATEKRSPARFHIARAIHLGDRDLLVSLPAGAGCRRHVDHVDLEIEGRSAQVGLVEVNLQ